MNRIPRRMSVPSFSCATVIGAGPPARAATGAERLAPQSVAIRIALFYAAIFAVIGLRMPFWPLWLSGRGLDPGEIGVVLAVSSWMQVAAAPWVASRVDRRGERRRVLAILAAAAALGYALFALTGGFLGIVLVAGLVAAVFTPILPLGDNLAMLAVGRYGIDYGRARLWGRSASWWWRRRVVRSSPASPSACCG